MSDPNVSAPGDTTQQSAATPESGSQPANTDPNASTPLSLADDSVVAIPGQNKPVKFGEWYRGIQGSHTKATQERAELQRRIEAIERERQQERAELARYRSVNQPPSPQQQRQQQAAAIKAKIAKLPYLTGTEATEMYESIVNDLGQRDDYSQRQTMAVRLLAQELQKIQAAVGELRGSAQQSGLKSRLASIRQEIGAPEGFEEVLEEIYLGYEPGEQLDREFPAIAKARWEKIQQAVRAADKAALDSQRSNRFTPPKGGLGTPSKSLDFSGKSSKEQADILWDMMQGQGT